MRVTFEEANTRLPRRLYEAELSRGEPTPGPSSVLLLAAVMDE